MKKTECEINCNLEALLMEGLRSGKSDEMRASDWQEVRRQLVNRLEKREVEKMSRSKKMNQNNLVASLCGIVKNRKFESKKYLGDTSIPRKFGVQK